MKKFMILFIAGVLGAAMLTGCKGGDEGTTGTSAADSTATTKMDSAPKADASAPPADAAPGKMDAAPKTDAAPGKMDAAPGKMGAGAPKTDAPPKK